MKAREIHQFVVELDIKAPLSRKVKLGLHNDTGVELLNSIDELTRVKDETSTPFEVLKSFMVEESVSVMQGLDLRFLVFFQSLRRT